MPMLWLEQLLISIQNRHCFETWRKNRKLNCKLEENKELIILLKRHGLVMRKAKPTKPN
jgi:hypothetical protein